MLLWFKVYLDKQLLPFSYQSVKRVSRNDSNANNYFKSVILNETILFLTEFLVYILCWGAIDD